LSHDARSLALSVLFRVSKENAFASSALRVAFGQNRGLGPADRGLATELVYGILRRRGLLDRAIAGASGRRIKDIDPKILDVLRLGAYQILYLDRIPPHAAVSTAVDLAKQRRAGRGASFVNAVLRRLVHAPELPPPADRAEDPAQHLADVGSLPSGLARRLIEDLGEDEALAFALASLEPGPLTLRANLLRTTQADLQAEVGGVAGELPWAVRLPQAGGALPADLLAVREGRATPQDEASMRVVALLDPQPGERILDLCAAPGGKTTHAAELMRDEGEVVAHDRLPARLARVAQAAQRLGLTSVKTSEALPPDAATFDRVLVDAPCSGLGTLRRHPEIRWRLTQHDVDELTRTQAEVLAQGAARVRPGGTLVYSVCTVTRAEGEAHLEALGGAFDVQEVLRTGPHQPGAPDGFFAARLVKRG
jgi:16S rRNA (cytosine967-C5)-methyltransferase